MPTKHLLALLLLSSSALWSCSGGTHAVAGDPPEYFAALSQADARAELDKVNSQLEGIDEDIRAAENRRDNALQKQGTDATKEAALSGAEADLDAIQSRKGALIHKKTQLERRLRDFQSNEY